MCRSGRCWCLPSCRLQVLSKLMCRRGDPTLRTRLSLMLLVSGCEPQIFLRFQEGHKFEEVPLVHTHIHIHTHTQMPHNATHTMHHGGGTYKRLLLCMEKQGRVGLKPQHPVQMTSQSQIFPQISLGKVLRCLKLMPSVFFFFNQQWWTI